MKNLLNGARMFSQTCVAQIGLPNKRVNQTLKVCVYVQIQSTITTSKHHPSLSGFNSKKCVKFRVSAAYLILKHNTPAGGSNPQEGEDVCCLVWNL